MCVGERRAGVWGAGKRGSEELVKDIIGGSGGGFGP